MSVHLPQREWKGETISSSMFDAMLFIMWPNKRRHANVVYFKTDLDMLA